MESMKKSYYALGIVLVLLFAVITGCAKNNAAQPQSTTVTVEGASNDVKTKQVSENSNNAEVEATDVPVKTDATKKTENFREFQVSAFRYGFSPDPITVNKGDYVRLLITSDDVNHGFAIPEYGVSAEIKPGKTTIVEFLADKQGEFTVFCSVFCGSGHGTMKGTLVVK